MEELKLKALIANCERIATTLEEGSMKAALLKQVEIGKKQMAEEESKDIGM